MQHLPKQGTGDPERYRRIVAELIQRGLGVKQPVPAIANALQTGFSSKKFGVVIDAGTLPWAVIANLRQARPDKFSKLDSHYTPSFSDETRKPEAYVPFLREYSRIGGRVVLFTEHGLDWSPPARVLRDALYRAGARRVEEFDVVNKYEMDLPKEVEKGIFRMRRNVLKHMYDYKKALVAEW